MNIREKNRSIIYILAKTFIAETATLQHNILYVLLPLIVKTENREVWNDDDENVVFRFYLPI